MSIKWSDLTSASPTPPWRGLLVYFFVGLIVFFLTVNILSDLWFNIKSFFSSLF
tara:strand:- start:518 stop:679 length:162 start_codon:yes stop_codon:yes gene_type:complete